MSSEVVTKKKEELVAKYTEFLENPLFDVPEEISFIEYQTQRDKTFLGMECPLTIEEYSEAINLAEDEMRAKYPDIKYKRRKVSIAIYLAYLAAHSLRDNEESVSKYINNANYRQKAGGDRLVKVRGSRDKRKKEKSNPVGRPPRTAEHDGRMFIRMPEKLKDAIDSASYRRYGAGSTSRWIREAIEMRLKRGE